MNLSNSKYVYSDLNLEFYIHLCDTVPSTLLLVTKVFRWEVERIDQYFEYIPDAFYIQNPMLLNAATDYLFVLKFCEPHEVWIYKMIYYASCT